ncbi:MAG: outer membrane protein assembly factor BamD [Candidatus Omnitrophica bacterium]|nr:outer membrane protein assembly factor BamD [Candidatus Omnitrophota bacterium]
MKKNLSILFAVFFCLMFTVEAQAFWVWFPKTKKLINPKYMPKDTPEEQFKYAMKLFKAKNYTQAAEHFNLLVSYFKESDLAPEAQYYAGRSYEKAGKYYPAFTAYQNAISNYPLSKRIDEIIEREYNLGMELYKKHSGKLMGKEIMTDLDRAIEIFQKVRDNAPFGEYGDKAQFMIGQCYKKAEQYKEATEAFQKLTDEYPQSELVDKAKYEVAQCTYLASLKPDYDQEFTDEAIKEFKTMVKEDSSFTLSKEAEKTISRLEDKKAESLFKTAKFYEQQKHYTSAAIYYKEVLKNYPLSSFSDLARQRLIEIEILLKNSGAKGAFSKASKNKKWIFF